jgi:TrmH family RNA methyltransferase
MGDWKDNIYFILVEPEDSSNIGACARALKNMGFKRLELVSPANFNIDEARHVACSGNDILENAIIHGEFKKAIKDKSLVVGTTRRLGKRRGLILNIKDGVKRILKSAHKNKIAILFGRERNGLTNEEVEECGFLITIPANPLAPSINLAQSVLLVAYELSQKYYKVQSPEFVTHEQLNMLYERIRKALEILEYIPRGDRNLEEKIMRNLKHLVGRACLTEWELKMIHGIITQFMNKFGEVNSKVKIKDESC